MRRFATFLTIASMLLLVSELSAQAKPNFTGKWVAIADSSAGAAAARAANTTSALGDAGSITQDEKSFTIERTSATAAIKIVVNLDGSESKNALALNGMLGAVTQTTSKARWDGNKLIVTTAVVVNEDTSIELTSTFSLDATSGILSVESSLPGAQGAAPRVTK